MPAQWLYGLLVILGTVALAVPRATPAILGAPSLPPSRIAAVLGVVPTALGIGIAIAARIFLAAYYVRHPIYSGLLLALLGTAIALERCRRSS